ncbi:MAG: outer membrane beta-barrel protein [Ferruginibacter sp.]
MKTIFLIAILSASHFCALSQKKIIEGGFDAGINFNAELGGTISKDVKAGTVGFNAGAHIKINSTKNFGVKAFLQYEQYGWKYRSLTFENSTGTGFAKGDVIYKFDYLNLTVLPEFTFGNKIKFNAGAGLFVGLLLNNKTTMKLQDQSAPYQMTTTSSKSNNLKPLNFGISGDIGIQIPINSKMKINFDVRDNAALTSIDKSESNSSGRKTNALSLIFGVSIPL